MKPGGGGRERGGDAMYQRGGKGGGGPKGGVYVAGITGGAQRTPCKTPDPTQSVNVDRFPPPAPSPHPI